MKNYLIFFITLISLSFSFGQDRIPSDPIPGVDVKLGRKPPGAIIAQGKTGADGSYEFKNLTPGKGYFVTIDFGIKEKGIKTTSQTLEIGDIEISNTTKTYSKKMKAGTVKFFNEAKGNKTAGTEGDELVLTVTAGNGTIKVRHDTVKNSINNIR